MADRYVVLGLAPAQRAWFREVSRWATAASLPVEFVKCVSLEELRVRLGSGRPFSAVLVDAAVAGVDRDLTDSARAAGCAVLVVDDGRVRRDWPGLGVSAVLPSTFGRAELLTALGEHSERIGRGEAVAEPVAPAPGAGAWRGSVVAVTGAGGAGASTVAMAVAQALGGDPRHAGLVVLADLALDADQAVLHDSGDVVPGLQELVEAHRAGAPSIEEVRALTWDVPGRGYALLLGLRRHRDWAALRPRAIEAALDGLRRAYRIVVADIEPDVEGEEQCGSTDVEDRNSLARAAARRAAVVLAVGMPGPKGVRSLLRVVDGLLDLGVDAARIVPVVNRAPRSPRARAEITRAVAELAGTGAHGAAGAAGLPSPVFVPERRRLDDLVHDGHPLPGAMCTPVGSVVASLLEHPPAEVRGDAAPAPVRVEPGSLGTR